MDEKDMKASPELLAAFAALLAEVEQIAEDGDCVTVNGARSFFRFYFHPEEATQRNVHVHTFHSDGAESSTPGGIADRLALDQALVDGDLGAIVNKVAELKRLSGSAVPASHGILDLTFDDFGLDEDLLDEKWLHVTWITSPDGIGHEVWVRSQKGGYLVFSIMPQNYPSIGIWLDDKSVEEFAAKLHVNCAGWEAIRLHGGLDEFLVVVGEDSRIMSVDDLAASDDPARRAWAERIPVLCQQVDDRMQKKTEERLQACRQAGTTVTAETSPSPLRSVEPAEPPQEPFEGTPENRCVPIVYVSIKDFSERVRITPDEAKAWLAKEDHLGLIREALYPDPCIYGDALLTAYERSLTPEEVAKRRQRLEYDGD